MKYSNLISYWILRDAYGPLGHSFPQAWMRHLTGTFPSSFPCLDKELQALRGENRKNMLLSVALLVLSALFYYIFLHSEDDSTQLD